MKTSLKFLLLCFLMLSGQLASEAFASPNVTIAPMSDNVYAIQCGDFSDIRKVDITIQYDAAAFTAPRVVQSGLAADAILAVTDSKQGVLRFTLDQKAPTWLRRWTLPPGSGRLAINGSGTLAIVTFVRTMSTGADILSLAASAVSGTGQGITVATQVVNIRETADSGTGTEQQTGRTEESPVSAETAHETTPAATVATAPAITATLQAGGTGMAAPSGRHFPSDDGGGATPLLDQPAVEIRQPDNDAAIFPKIANTESDNKPVPKTSEHKKTMKHQSVLERFREYKGEKTPETLMALFSAGGEGELRQDPPLVLSDGKTTLNVVVELDSKDNNFYLDGASLVSLKNKEKNYWVVELLPKKNALTATITIPRNDQWHVASLTVAPPWDVTGYLSSGKSAEADFRGYLKERGMAKSPGFDLNGDGRRDYIDDYIFTANFIVERDSKAKAPTPQ
jgi:hypothetical protein